MGNKLTLGLCVRPRLRLWMLLAAVVLLCAAYAEFGWRWTVIDSGKAFCTRCGARAEIETRRLGPWTSDRVTNVRESNISKYLRRHWGGDCRRHDWGYATADPGECLYFTNIFLDHDLAEPKSAESFETLANRLPEDTRLLFALILDWELDPGRNERTYSHFTWHELDLEFGGKSLSSPEGVLNALEQHYRKRIGKSWVEVRAEISRRLALRDQ